MFSRSLNCIFCPVVSWSIQCTNSSSSMSLHYVYKKKKKALLIEVSSQWFWPQQCINQENDQISGSQKWSEKILESEERQKLYQWSLEQREWWKKPYTDVFFKSLGKSQQLEAVRGSVTILKRFLGTKLWEQENFTDCSMIHDLSQKQRWMLRELRGLCSAF